MDNAPKLISTAIMKTDIKGFSKKIGILSDLELSKLLQNHKEFIIRSVYKYKGSIIKGEGDAFLISFSSVTAAAESAIDIQNDLMNLREGTDDTSRLSVRIVITLGDVLHKDNDVFGESVNIISRIEDITPPDEIYLSESALLTLRKKEINTELVGEFNFKGFNDKFNIYKIILGRKTIVLNNIYILFSDLANFASVKENYSLAEKLIDYSDIMFNTVEKNNNATIRGIYGDAYILTFTKIDDILASLKYIHSFWEDAFNKYKLLRLRLGIHKGKMLQYRRFFGGESVNMGAVLESSGKYTDAFNDTDNIVVTHVSDLIYSEIIELNTTLKNNFNKITEKELKKYKINSRLLKYIKNNFKSTYTFEPNN